MAEQVFNNARLLVGRFDIGGKSNRIAMKYSADVKETTTFGSGGAKTKVAGLTDFDVSGGGLAEYGADLNDGALFGNVAVLDSPLTLCPNSGAAGLLAFFSPTVQGSYETLGPVGDVVPFSLDLHSRGTPLVRGTVLRDDLTAVTATGNGTGFQLGAVGANQRVYAALHVLSLTGSGSVVVKVRSAADNTFAGQTDRITFASAAAPASELLSAAGPVADTWWRVGFTVTGTPVATLVVVVGVK